MQKAGTAYLYDLLRQTSGTWITPRKELHHFDDVLVQGINSQRAKDRAQLRQEETESPLFPGVKWEDLDASHIEQTNRHLVSNGLPPQFAYDIEFWKRFITYHQTGRKHDAYNALFSVAPDNF